MSFLSAFYLFFLAALPKDTIYTMKTPDAFLILLLDKGQECSDVKGKLRG